MCVGRVIFCGFPVSTSDFTVILFPLDAEGLWVEVLKDTHYGVAKFQQMDSWWRDFYKTKENLLNLTEDELQE